MTPRVTFPGKLMGRWSVGSQQKNIASVTYLIYCIFYLCLLLGGPIYLIFFKGGSGWWLVLGILLCGSTYRLEKWNDVFGE